MTFPHPHNLRTVSMPLGMVVGAMFCRPIAALETASGGMITPSLIFLMLFFTFCRVDVRSMRLSPIKPCFNRFHFRSPCISEIQFI